MKQLRTLLDASDWMAALCSCPDRMTRRLGLYLCAKVVLPYWEGRFQRDDGMSLVVEKMYAAATIPSIGNDLALAAAIPNRVRRHWDLSPPPGFFDEGHGDCPADFAGDSIFYAASAFDIDSEYDADDFSSFRSAVECFARLFVERDSNYSDDKDYIRAAGDHLLAKIKEELEAIATR